MIENYVPKPCAGILSDTLMICSNKCICLIYNIKQITLFGISVSLEYLSRREILQLKHYILPWAGSAAKCRNFTLILDFENVRNKVTSKSNNTAATMYSTSIFEGPGNWSAIIYDFKSSSKLQQHAA